MCHGTQGTKLKNVLTSNKCFEEYFRVYCDDNDVENIKRVLYQSRDNYSLLSECIVECIKHGYLETTKLFLEYHVDLDKALYAAIKYNRLEIARLFLNCTGIDFKKHLRICTSLSRLEIFKLLLTTQESSDYNYLLFVANKWKWCLPSLCPIKQYLVDLGAVDCDELFLKACKTGDSENVVKLYHMMGGEGSDCIGMGIATEHRQVSVIKTLLEIRPLLKGVCLRTCTRFGYTDLFKIFLKDHHNSFSFDCNEVLLMACQKQNIEIITELIESGFADPSYSSSASLRTAVSRGNLEIVKLLVSAGADINCKTGRPLRIAKKHGYTEIIEYLQTKK